MIKKLLFIGLFLVMVSPAVAMNEEYRRNRATIFRAVKAGDAQALRQALDANLPRGDDPLALYFGDAPTAEIAQILIDRGADVNEQPQDASFLQTMQLPALRLIMQMPIEIAAVLLKHGADANAVDAFGVTPLGYVVQDWNMRPSNEKLQLLLAYGADPSMRCFANNMIVDDARSINHEIVPLLERQQKILGLLKANNATNVVDLIRNRPISGHMRIPRN